MHRLRDEYKRAQTESKNLIEHMETFLKQNHNIVQDFLKTTHKAIINLSKPVRPVGGMPLGSSRRESDATMIGGRNNFARGKTL